jgi:hypothetical protein
LDFVDRTDYLAFMQRHGRRAVGGEGFSMNAIVAIVPNSGIPGFIDVRDRGFTARTQTTGPGIRGAEGAFRVESVLSRVVRGIGQLRERQRQAEIARRNSPLSLDDAWAGGWYARSRAMQEALLQRECSAGAKPVQPTQDWDDKLD